ncbi:MAG: hypothetical protein FJ267_09310, partial [Planctomycetes bacterium]|nr:hypothetical protein [Planctomycetota bacterium]
MVSSFLFTTILIHLTFITAQPLFAAPDDQIVTEKRKPPQAQQNFGRIEFNEQNLNQWIFQGVNTESGARSRLSSQLKIQFDELDRVCNLKESQRQKLRLAAMGDERKFFGEVDAIRKKYQKLKNQDENEMQQHWQQLWQEIQPLQQKVQAGLLGPNSLFQKTLRRTLDEDQLAKYEANDRARRQFRYAASIDVAMIRFERKVPLKNNQREALRKLLLEKTVPPRVFGHQDYNFVMFQLSRLPKDTIRPLFDEQQWKAFSEQTEGNSLNL